MHRIPEAWKLGITMLPIDDDWILKNNQTRKYAIEYIRFLEGDNIILAAFGGGFTWGSIWVKWAYDSKN